MNAQGLKPGDRVRITREVLSTGFLPGDRGEVLAGPREVAGSRLRFYFVTIEEVSARTLAVFAEDEIEPDV